MALKLQTEAVSFVQLCQHAPKLCNAAVSSTVTVPASSEMVISAKLEAPCKGILPHGYTGVFEPYYADHSNMGFAWTVTRADMGSVKIKVMNPSLQAVTLYSGTQIGSFYSVTGTSHEEYMLIDHSVCHVSIDSSSPQKTCLLPDISSSELTPDQQLKLQELLDSFSDVFSQHSRDYGRTKLVTHKIRTSDETPICQRAYRTSPAMKTEIHRQVEELKQQDVVEDSQSPWASPVVMVKKKDNTYRFCVDYQKLNSVTITDSHPLPRVDDSLDALSGSHFFSTMDLSSGYWQVELHPADREKTAFSTGDGLYQFKVMPMGLKNPPPIFQRLIELVLRGLLGQHVLFTLTI